jgi:hypothetical protein
MQSSFVALSKTRSLTPIWHVHRRLIYTCGLDLHRLWCYKTTSEEVGFKLIMTKCNIHNRGGRISSPHLHRGCMFVEWEGVYRASQ